MNAHFDKLGFVDRLRRVGLTEDVARAIVDGVDQALQEEVATKSDLKEVQNELHAVEARLRSDMDLGFAQMDTKFAQMDVKFALIEKNVGDRIRNYVLAGFAFVSLLMTALHFIK